MSLDRFAVVVLTWNTRKYTLDCLQSLAQQSLRHTVYVVDNASDDGTVAAVSMQFPAARIIANTENLGFAGGNNCGLRAAFDDGADAVLVLNNDTTLEPDSLAHLREAANRFPNAGILSPLILFAAPPHDVWFAGATLNIWTGRSAHQHYRASQTAVPPAIRSIQRATGCAMLITRSCYERIGGFADAFFMYYEDVEYSLRSRDAGFGILLVPLAVVYHHVSASMGGEKMPNTIYYMMRNSTVTLEWHAPLPLPLSPVRRLLIALLVLLFILRSPSVPARMRDLVEGYRDARRGLLGPRGSDTGEIN